MTDTLISPEHSEAIQSLIDRFTLRSDDANNLLKLAAGDRVLVESALLVAREMGYQPFEGAQQYITDVLHLSVERA